MEANTAKPEQQSVELPTTLKEIFPVVLLGAIVGLVVVVLTALIARFVIEPLFCRSADSIAMCASGGTIAFNSALVIVSMIAVVALVKLSVFRPLLVALGAAASLWGMNAYLSNLSVVEYTLWIELLFMLSYLLFFWLMRARRFLISAVSLILAIVLIRAVLVL